MATIILSRAIILYFCRPILEINSMRKSFIILLLLVAPLCLLAQVEVVRASEIVKIGDTEYYMHHVEAGQTLYGISKAYDVTIEEITRLNPEVADGLKADMVIGIPVVGKSGTENVSCEGKDEMQLSQSQQEKSLVQGDVYVVQHGEDLYDIAKRFGIDVSVLKAVNEGLDNYPAAGTVVKLPAIVNEDDYIVHQVEKQERVSSLVKRWKVTEEAFRAMNISVGNRVFVGQVVLIPIDLVEMASHATAGKEPGVFESAEEDTVGVVNQFVADDDAEAETECVADPANAMKRYHVALLVPLYLGEVSGINVAKEHLVEAQNARPFSFLQFYEGFMLAVDSLVKTEGLRLDLTVVDVTENVATANAAVKQLEQSGCDLIIGPFFGKSFAVVASYAKEKGIVMVNPLSTRESILEGSPNVVKLKPGLYGQIDEVANLVKNRYADANVFVVSQEKAGDSVFLNELERQLILSINEEVAVGNGAIMQYAKDESKRLEMGKRIVPTVTVEGQVYSTDDLRNNSESGVTFLNAVHRYSYDELESMIAKFSGVRTNFIVAYGDNNVFATQMLNGLKKSCQKYPITLVALPEWEKFEKLSVETLLQTNAIYMSSGFVDYSNEAVSQFVLNFREKYGCEALNYAFEGFDVAWYFLNALMRYGSDMLDCLPSCEIPLLRSSYRFGDSAANRGLENHYWSMYQYDSETIELRPVDPFKRNETIVK